MVYLNIFSQLIIATLFGGMVFFPSVVAPVVFRALDEGGARKFLRALFPRYYTFMIGLSVVGAAALGIAMRWPEAGWMVFVALSTLWVRQWLMPRINDARDASLTGDDEASARFKKGHTLSVQINMVQMVGVLVVLALL